MWIDKKVYFCVLVSISTGFSAIGIMYTQKVHFLEKELDIFYVFFVARDKRDFAENFWRLFSL